MKNKIEKEKLLDKFIRIEGDKTRAGSGDDEFYVKQVDDYINEQRQLWFVFMEFVAQQIFDDNEKVMDDHLKYRGGVPSRIDHIDWMIIFNELKKNWGCK